MQLSEKSLFKFHALKRQKKRPGNWARIGLLVILASCSGAAPAAMADEMEELAQMTRFVELMQGYYASIEAAYNVASNPEKSAILQMQKIDEIYKNRGDQAESIKFLRQVMKTTDNVTVRNVASIMLGDALNETGHASEAVKVLRASLEENIH